MRLAPLSREEVCARQPKWEKHQKNLLASLWKAPGSDQDVQILFPREVGSWASQKDKALWYKRVWSWCSPPSISIPDLIQGLPKLALCLLIVLQTCDLVLGVLFDQITNIRGASLFPVSSLEWTQSWALMGALEPSVPVYCLCPHVHTPGLQTTREPCPVHSLTCHLPVRSDWPVLVWHPSCHHTHGTYLCGTCSC